MDVGIIEKTIEKFWKEEIYSFQINTKNSQCQIFTIWQVLSDRITIWSQMTCCFILIVMFTERCPVGILCDDPPRCVPNEARCNAIADCADGTDELSCPGRSCDTQRGRLSVDPSERPPHMLFNME